MLAHIRTKHPHVDVDKGFGPVKYQTNKQFVDPYPITLDMVFPRSSTSISSFNGPALQNIFFEGEQQA